MNAIRFGAAPFLPLLVVPAALFALALWQAWRRIHDRRAVLRAHTVSVRERIPFIGELLAWFCFLIALTLTLLALARPLAVTSLVRTAGVDLIVLQDGSASMATKDMSGDRWRRSVRFLRTLGESLRWEDDRVAMALFAHIATPQIRLTKDPNTYFFFLDHMEEKSPFRIEDDATWDTNIERGIYWGLRLVEKDQEVRTVTAAGGTGSRGARAGDGAGAGAGARAGAAGNDAVTTSGSERGRGAVTRNSKAFVLVSDGQAWSGEVAKSIALAQEASIPVHVVGVGTTAGAIIPDPKREPMQAGVRSQLDRASLSVIATAGGGRYFELERDGDREIANTIIDLTRRRAGTEGVEEGTVELYRQFLMGAAVALGLAVLFLRHPVALALQLAAATGVLIYVSRLF
jgi:hypothetical protein